MNTLASRSAASSAVPSVSDLDAYNFTSQEYSFNLPTSYFPLDDDDFGFDPPVHKSTATYATAEHAYSPPDPADAWSFSGWPGMEQDTKHHLARPDSRSGPGAAYGIDLDQASALHLPNGATATSRYGQITPPRSDSMGSSVETKPSLDHQSPTAPENERRKRTSTSKVSNQDSAEPASASAVAPAKSGRKRKQSSRSRLAAPIQDAPEDDKRKQSLEKNRLAAAKCRVNKKDKTEQLQRDSHDKLIHNAYLKDQVIRMKEEVQQMNAILLSHANCEGCKSPHDIQKHLTHLSHEFFANHASLSGPAMSSYDQMDMLDTPKSTPAGAMRDSYFPRSAGPQNASSLHPPLPEFNRSAEFEVHTPMQTD